ncbi:MAG: hypothetical protein NVV66_18175 [Cellulomonas sp.]|uniref:hypothetical protein n=1 Tax=Cellulomonas sp. TaxID=40001 RepID=UPI00258637E3|nr:hypothetical protein [Cellulomonas sp.]MCR6706524.1 hypothetical protein [Cellulomonas sp.]
MSALALALALVALGVAVGETTFQAVRRRRASVRLTAAMREAFRRADTTAPTGSAGDHRGDGPSSGEGHGAAGPVGSSPVDAVAPVGVDAAPAPTPTGCPRCDRVAEQQTRYRAHMHRTKHAHVARP